MSAAGWGLVVAGPARRALERLPEKVAAAVLEFLLGPLTENPHRVSVELRGRLAGLRSARVGSYWIVFELDEDPREIRVLRIAHRADVYRPR